MSATLRPPRDEDLPTVVRLQSEHRPEPVDAEMVVREWTSPGVELEHDARIEDDAYCLVEDLYEGRAWIELHGRPSTALLDWAEARASEKGARLFTRSVVDQPAAARDVRTAWLRAHPACAPHGDRSGGSRCRTADWPEGIAVRAFRPGDERTFYDVHQETFEDTWEPIRESYEEWSHWLLAATRVRSRALVPGASLVTSRPGSPSAIRHPTRPELGWVKILGVRRAWRRRGLGPRSSPARVRGVREARPARCRPRGGRAEPHRRQQALRATSACTSPRVSTSTRRRSRELAPRTLPGLPDADRRGDGTGIRVPCVRPGVRSRARACPPSVGSGRRSDGRGCFARASVSGDRRRRRVVARRADARPSGGTSRAPRRAGRLLLHACRSRRGAHAPRWPARSRVVRRTRRPQHARDVSVRKSLGDAVPDADRRRHRRSRGCRPRRSAQPRSGRDRLSRRDRDRRLARPRARRARRASTSRSTSTCSIRPRSRSSCPSPTDRVWMMWRRCWPTWRGGNRLSGIGVTGLVPDDSNGPW